MSNQHTCHISRNMTAVFRVFSWRIILNRFYFDGRHYTSTMQCLKTCWALLKPCTMRPSQFTRGDMSLQHIPIPRTYTRNICVCRCCDFVPATRSPLYTSLLHVPPQCVLYTRFSLQHEPSCLATLREVW